jgi:hypothetical protein
MAWHGTARAFCWRACRRKCNGLYRVPGLAFARGNKPRGGSALPHTNARQTSRAACLQLSCRRNKQAKGQGAALQAWSHSRHAVCPCDPATPPPRAPHPPCLRTHRGCTTCWHSAAGRPPPRPQPESACLSSWPSGPPRAPPPALSPPLHPEGQARLGLGWVTRGGAAMGAHVIACMQHGVRVVPHVIACMRCGVRVVPPSRPSWPALAPGLPLLIQTDADVFLFPFDLRVPRPIALS